MAKSTLLGSFGSNLTVVSWPLSASKVEKINESYLGRILRLTLLAPDIIEAILTGHQSNTLQLDDLLKPLPALWKRQYSALIEP